MTIFSAEPARGWLPWGALAPFLAIVFVAAPLLAVSGVLERFDLVDSAGDPVGLTGLLAFLLFPFAAIALVVLVWVHFVERRPLATIGLGAPGRVRLFLRGHLIGIATIAAVVAAIWLAGGLEAHGVVSAFASPPALLGIAFLLVCFAVQSSAEELIFRGWLLSAVARKFNLPVGVLLTSAVFCFLHYAPAQFWLVTVNMFLFSAFACCWSIRAGNIWGVMGWHAGWNWLLATGFELPVTGMDTGLPALVVGLTPVGSEYLTGGAQGPEGSIFCTILFVSGIAAIRLQRKNCRNRATALS